MPTLKEFRAILRKGIGNTVIRDITIPITGTEHLYDVPKTKTGIDLSKMTKKSESPKYTASPDGKDAIVHFGEHSGLTLTSIFDKAPTYLSWIIKTFSEREDSVSVELVEITKFVIRGKS